MTEHQTPRPDDHRTTDFNAHQGVETRYCPNCGGNFAFDPAAQELRCDSCGTGVSIEHDPDATIGLNSFNHRKGPSSAMAPPVQGGFAALHQAFVDISSASAQPPPPPPPVKRQDRPPAPVAPLASPALHAPNTLASPGTLAPSQKTAASPPAAFQAPVNTADQMTHLEGENEIVCQSCGGRTTFVGTLTSTKCPYCAAGLQLADVHEAPDRLPVDGVLPFALTELQATENLERWIDSRWFAPTEFKKYSNAGSFSSMYAAYFTYDADATTDYRGQRGKTRGSGNNRRTDWNHVSGQVHDRFQDLSVLANTGLEPKFVRALEPWPTQKLKPFSADYLAGHLAKTYDHDADHCFKEARAVMNNQIDRTIKRDIGGDKQRITSRSTTLTNTAYRHVLFPIWLLTVVYAGQTWQVFMNGDTGEVHGERPYSRAKIAFASAIVAAIVLAIVLLWARTKST